MNTYLKALHISGHFLDLTIIGTEDVSELDKQLLPLYCLSSTAQHQQNQDGKYSLRLNFLPNIDQCLQAIRNSGFFVVSHKLDHATLDVKATDHQAIGNLIEPFVIAPEAISSMLAKKEEAIANAKLANCEKQKKQAEEDAAKVLAKVAALAQPTFLTLERLCTGIAYVIPPRQREALLEANLISRYQGVGSEVRQAVSATRRSLKAVSNN